MGAGEEPGGGSIASSLGLLKGNQYQVISGPQARSRAWLCNDLAPHFQSTLCNAYGRHRFLLPLQWWLPHLTITPSMTWMMDLPAVRVVVLTCQHDNGSQGSHSAVRALAGWD